jgi:D-alanyl-D-alanine carboxypeptidase/D-alanyl-D-alanine-endopeptidase (penicillin-binding protein 4)
MNLRIFVVFITILITQDAVSQQKFDIVLQNLLSKPEYRNATVGFYAIDSETGETLADWNSEKLMIPASTLKIITSAAALEILGPGYRFTTKAGFVGNISNHTLKGDLVIVGGGDPALGSEYFESHYYHPHFLKVWAQKIKAAGITKIDGDLVLDGSLYDTEEIPPTWIWEDIGNYYGAGPSAFSVYDNFFRITFSSPAEAGKPAKIIATNPEMDGLEMVSEVLSSDENRDLAYVFGGPLDKKRKITGTIPKNRKAFTIKAAVSRPEELLAEELFFHLAESGIFISGKVRFEKTEKNKFQTIYVQESPPLSEIIKVVNHESVNLFAEHLVKQIAAEKNGLGNREEGIKIIGEFWQSKGVGSGFFMEDGSGLSHFNAVSPAQFVSVLEYMLNKSSNAEDFLYSLPGAGDGTLSGFDSAVFTGNKLKAKSGSMARVRCYVGYLKAVSGREIVFSVMFNHFSGTHAQLVSEIESLLFEMKNLF